MVSEALGKEVGWDGNTNTISLSLNTKLPSNSSINDLPPVNASITNDGTIIEVYYKQLKYKINGEMKNNLGGQGFIYNDTTYVPLRMISEALGDEVGWDGSTNTISLGAVTAPNVNLSTTTNVGDSKSLTTFPFVARDEAKGFLAVNEWGRNHNSSAYSYFTINNQSYKEGFGLYMHNNPYPPYIKSGGNMDIKLEGFYSRFTALVGLDNSVPSNTATGTLKIIGDSKELLSVTDIKPGQDPKTIDVDVTGVQFLSFNFQSDRKGLLNMIIANPMVTKNNNPTTVIPKTPLPTTTPTPTLTPVPSVPPQSDSELKDVVQNKGDVVITSRDQFREAVAIRNYGYKKVDLKGWKIVSTFGGETYTFSDSHILGAYGIGPEEDTVSIVSGNFAETVSRFPTNTYYKIWSMSEIWDNNSYDNVELYNASGELVSRYSCKSSSNCTKKSF
ncbi:hypothetical protein J2736_002739 [Paenibacillus qinlingensis]|uniref:LTD domain-containing protein n=2 Tax=Paenibacillus qinlingensis TaxID=1837343 RepID=A0ABU1NVQ2_9BACL|nr:hypothetical protein [Paenibacillus qinlingensis]